MSEDRQLEHMKLFWLNPLYKACTAALENIWFFYEGSERYKSVDIKAQGEKSTVVLQLHLD